MRAVVAMLGMLTLPLVANAADSGSGKPLETGARDHQFYVDSSAPNRELTALLKAKSRFGFVPENADRPSRTRMAPEYESPLAKAIRLTRKTGIIEDGVSGYAEVLAACQQEQSPLLTLPFQTADSQQDHCFRF